MGAKPLHVRIEGERAPIRKRIFQPKTFKLDENGLLVGVFYKNGFIVFYKSSQNPRFNWGIKLTSTLSVCLLPKRINWIKFIKPWVQLLPSLQIAFGWRMWKLVQLNYQMCSFVNVDQLTRTFSQLLYTISVTQFYGSTAVSISISSH